MEKDYHKKVDLNRTENSISRKDFLKKSLAAGVLFNLKHKKTVYPSDVFSVTNPPQGQKELKNQQKNNGYWHGQIRKLRYKPDGGDFVITNGGERFNRSLYGTHTAFRVEAGDLPEFALYMPGLGGTFKMGLLSGKKSKWLINADRITTQYRPGALIYEIEDTLLKNGRLEVYLLAMSSAEGMVVKARFEHIPDDIQLIGVFGGANDKHFSRNGDLGADPVSGFFLQPDHCKGNEFHIDGTTFKLLYGQKKKLQGVFPVNSRIHIANAEKLNSPAGLLKSSLSDTPVITGTIKAESSRDYYFCVYNPFIKQYNPDTVSDIQYSSLPTLFEEAENARKALADRVKVNTPDPYINTYGGALSVAGDAIWESPSYMHGAVAWRMRLNGWRGPYVADPLGWHDRARMHFSSYALSQLKSPVNGPNVPNPELHLARQLEEIGTAVFSSGYICRNPGGYLQVDHYDMNLCYIDELLWHFKWTGEWAYVKEMWPVLKRHLAWEKRCFDADDDGLYDAYCCIWASDAIEYSGGDVTHSSAYNYRANKMAAFIAGKIGEDPTPFENEAKKIRSALNNRLWLPEKGWYAEFQDTLGRKEKHPAAGLWTLYHAIDSEVPDPFMAYQATRYIDTQIPHIPVKAEGLPDEGYYTLSTTNWMPYMWSANNVVMAEIFHTSLAYWQAGRNDEAFKLWKSTLLDNMYMGQCPGNFEQISFYDAFRGELYRDFADPIGMGARTLVEGLFGINPDALNGVLHIHPGLPAGWDHASLEVPDVAFQFKRTGEIDTYFIDQHFKQKLKLQLILNAYSAGIQKVSVNGKEISWKNVEPAIGKPMIELDCGAHAKYKIEILWSGKKTIRLTSPVTVAHGDRLKIKNDKFAFLDVYDPQHTLKKIKREEHYLEGIADGETGHRTIFIKARQGRLLWWEPIDFEIVEPVAIKPDIDQSSDGLQFQVQNNRDRLIHGKLSMNGHELPGENEITLKPGASKHFLIQEHVLTGSNEVKIEWNDGSQTRENIINWNIKMPRESKLEALDLTRHFNDKVTGIFQNKYLSPRSPNPTLQIPTQGIGAWTAPFVMADIDDSGLRKRAGLRNKIEMEQGIVFKTPGRANASNIIFTSQWDNYPDEISIPVSGKASHIYLLMAGSTNWMQSRISNGEIAVQYEDGSESRLDLINPDSWWPIEQDYYTDGYAFYVNQPKPVRIHLKTGLIAQDFSDYTSIKGYTNQAIDSGAATVLDVPLDHSKTMKKIRLKSLVNEVVIGLMSATLVR